MRDALTLQIVSDIHTEFHADAGYEYSATLLNAGADALVVAGDFGTHTTFSGAMHVLCDRFERVLFVAGNHEYYRSSFTRTANVITEFASKHANFSWLNNTVEHINGTKVVGTTLWYPTSTATLTLKHTINDFKMIEDADQTFVNGAAAADFLSSNVDDETVVVTHHLPSYESVSQRYRTMQCNCYFVHDMSSLIRVMQPKLWIHGHTHDSKDYILTNSVTRIVCNPFGYPNSLNTGFENPKLVTI